MLNKDSAVVEINSNRKTLLEIDPAGFQRLCDSYLVSRGYDRINPIGLVIGADKVAKGTPDTLITRPDGKYVFAEYSTQQDGLAEKFMRDLAKCFDGGKMGIPVECIHEIVLCHNSRLTAAEEHEPGEECRLRGVILSTYGLGTMARRPLPKASWSGARFPPRRGRHGADHPGR